MDVGKAVCWVVIVVALTMTALLLLVACTHEAPTAGWMVVLDRGGHWELVDSGQQVFRHETDCVADLRAHHDWTGLFCIQVVNLPKWHDGEWLCVTEPRDSAAAAYIAECEQT